jgi:hypothetical protein
MTKDELIHLMRNWPGDTQVLISSFPFRANVQAVQCEPEEGEAIICVDRDSWKSWRR